MIISNNRHSTILKHSCIFYTATLVGFHFPLVFFSNLYVGLHSLFKTINISKYIGYWDKFWDTFQIGIRVLLPFLDLPSTIQYDSKWIYFASCFSLLTGVFPAVRAYLYRGISHCEMHICKTHREVRPKSWLNLQANSWSDCISYRSFPVTNSCLCLLWN